jgi:ribonuclease D
MPHDDEAGGQIHLHQGDLPEDLNLGNIVAIDTETMGLVPGRDRLCVIQLSSGDGSAHLVQFPRGRYDAPVLRRMLADQAVTKLFHFGRFDIAMLYAYLGVLARPVYCTKIASRLTRTYTDRHGLKDLCREMLGIEMDKQQQSSDWGSAELSASQMKYAASDVLYLHALKAKFDTMLEREGRVGLASSCFEFLPTRAALDLAGWSEQDIFTH